MKVMVTGSRDWTDVLAVEDALAMVERRYPPPYCLFHGCQRGADGIAAVIAACRGWEVRPFPPDFAAHATAAEAFKARNQAMIDAKPDLVLALPRHNSRGTWDAVSRANRAGIPVAVHPDVKRAIPG